MEKCNGGTMKFQARKIIENEIARHRHLIDYTDKELSEIFIDIENIPKDTLVYLTAEILRRHLTRNNNE